MLYKTYLKNWPFVLLSNYALEFILVEQAAKSRYRFCMLIHRHVNFYIKHNPHLIVFVSRVNVVSVWNVDFCNKSFKSNPWNRRYRCLYSKRSPTSNLLSWVVLLQNLWLWRWSYGLHLLICQGPGKWSYDLYDRAWLEV